uniref:ARGOS n=2 Tax=Solanum TaxID=4107 RepID=M1CXD8_SOLTU
MKMMMCKIDPFDDKSISTNMMLKNLSSSRVIFVMVILTITLLVLPLILPPLPPPPLMLLCVPVLLLILLVFLAFTPSQLPNYNVPITSL